MDKLFKYKIETVATDNPNRLETQVEIIEYTQSTKFLTGLSCNHSGFSNYNRGVYSIDVVDYAFDKCYKFSRDWIDIIMYDYYVLHLTNPEENYIWTAEKVVKDAIKNLNSFESFNFSYTMFLIGKFRDFHDDPSKPLNDPYYDEYSRYHRLLDCLIYFQLKNRTLLLKGTDQKQDLLELVKDFSIGMYNYNLENEFRHFLQWAHQNNINLLSEQDYDWVLKW